MSAASRERCEAAVADLFNHDALEGLDVLDASRRIVDVVLRTLMEPTEPTPWRCPPCLVAAKFTGGGETFVVPCVKAELHGGDHDYALHRVGLRPGVAYKVTAVTQELPL